MPMLITQQQELEEFCKKLENEKFITVDTEFIRDNSYWSKLCLIQVASGNNEDLVAAIDPLVKNIDLSCFYKIIDNEKILKVMHGSRQDIEIFFHATGNMPKNVFDTQIAGMVCGFGDQIGYEKLVKSMLKQTVDKSSRYTDWAKRPLNEKQLSYAISDVTHLRDIYRKMSAMLKKNKRESWIAEDHDILLHPDTYDSNPDNAWKRLKIKTNKAETIAKLKALATWRERIAQKQNRPRGRIMRDDILLNLALHSPKSVKDFDKIRRFPKDITKDNLETLVQDMKNAKPSVNDALQKKKKNINSSETTATIELLRVLLKHTCEEYNIAPKLLASASDLDALAQSDVADIPAMKDWRYGIFGKKALDLKHGKYGLTIQNGKIQLFPL